MWLSTKLLAIALVAFCTACDMETLAKAGLLNFQEDFHYSYSLQPGGKLTLDSFNGAVEVQGWDQDTVEITGSKYASTEELLREMEIKVVAAADSVQIRTIRPAGKKVLCGARFLIRVPYRTELDQIATSNGPLRFEDISGSIRSRSSNGAVRVSRVDGAVEITTSNGGVELERISGPASVRTSNGRVKATELSDGLEAVTSNGSIQAHVSATMAKQGVRLETSNGAIDLSLDSGIRDRIRASTSNAGITVRLPETLTAHVRAETSNAPVSTEFDVNREGSKGEGKLEGTIGSSSAVELPEVHLSTSNAMIRLLKL